MTKSLKLIILIICCTFFGSFKVAGSQLFIQNSLHRVAIYNSVAENFSNSYKEKQQVLSEQVKDKLQLNLSAHLLADLSEQTSVVLLDFVKNQMSSLAPLAIRNFFHNDIFRPPRYLV